MADVKSRRRTYDASGRRAKARETRTTVISAAGELFGREGYGATSIRSIAERAGVSPETIYATFGTKAALLRAWIDVQVAGDDEPIALIDRPWVEALRRESDPARRAEIFSEHGTAVIERAAPAMRVLRAAADSDPALADQVAEADRLRHRDATELVRLVLGDDAPEDRDLDELVDWFWAITSDELFTALVEGRGWSTTQYRRWVDTALAAAIQRSSRAEQVA